MNKNFHDADEDHFVMKKMFADEKSADENDFEKFAAPFSKFEDENDLLEIPDLKFDSPNLSESRKIADRLLNFEALIEMPDDKTANQTANSGLFAEAENEPASFALSAAKNNEQIDNDDREVLSQSAFQPESPGETIRKSGMAYSAAMVLFGSIVFALILGWFADLLFGTSPWGIVVGIVLGSIIGFLQFFRITSQILKDKE